MKALADAILPRIRTSVDPVPAEDYRDDPVSVPWVWIQPPSTSTGSKPAQDRYRQGLVLIDIWADSWEQVEDIEASLAWLNGHVTDAGYRYRLQPSVPVLEPGAAHLRLTYGVLYDDLRGL